jgi:hypothetical protein
MKTKILLLLAAASASSSSFANPIDVVIYGQGGRNVCVVQNTSAFSKRQYIARATNEMDAESEANNACLANADFASHCGPAKCADDSKNTGVFQARIDIKIGNTRVDLQVNGMHLGSQCMAQNTSAFSKKTYVAKAGTELEAQAIALDTCLQEADFASHCAINKCAEINEGPTVEVSTSEIELPKIKLPKFKRRNRRS